MKQKIEPFNADDLERVEAQRSWVRDHYEPQARFSYDTLQGKLTLLNAILQNKWIDPSETAKLQSLGITLGDALVQHLNLKWMSVEDEFGRDSAVVLEGTSIVIFPLTIISKRVERGEGVDVYEIFKGICKTVGEMKDKLS